MITLGYLLLTVVVLAILGFAIYLGSDLYLWWKSH